MGQPALAYEPVEEVVADEAAQQTVRLVMIQGGKSAAAAGGEAVVVGTGEAVAVGTGEAVVIGTGEAVGAGALAGSTIATGGAALLVIGLAALAIYLWSSDDELKATAGGQNPLPLTPPNPNQTPCPDPCPALIQEIRDTLTRNKRDPQNNGQGMHGLQHRWDEMITGPCGPGQRPYRLDPNGRYGPKPVYENHVDEYNSTKRALRNRVFKAIDALCEIPDQLFDDAMEAERRPPPTPNQWKGDPNRPCTDDLPPPHWNGPQQPPSARGI